SHIYNEIILDGFTYLLKLYSDQIIEYLIKDLDKNIFINARGKENKLSLAKIVISKHSKNCREDLFYELENKILHYFPKDASESFKRKLEYNKFSATWNIWGDLQKELLEVLPTHRTSS